MSCRLGLVVVLLLGAPFARAEDPKILKLNPPPELVPQRTYDPAPRPEVHTLQAPDIRETIVHGTPRRLETPKPLRPRAAWRDIAWSRSSDAPVSIDKSLFLLAEAVRILEEDLRDLPRDDDSPDAAAARYEKRFQYAVEELGEAVGNVLQDGAIGSNAGRYARTRDGAPSAAVPSYDVPGAEAAGLRRD